MMNVKLCVCLLGSFLLSVASCGYAAVVPFKVADDLHHPWSMAFLPDGEIIISERSGQLRRIVDGELLARPVSGLPGIRQYGQGGLMGLALHPQFAKNRWLYFAYASADIDGYSTHVARGKYQDGALTDVQTIFAANPKSPGGRHFGGRLLFDRKGYLFITLGDRGQRELAQQTDSHTGSIIRVHDDGRVPADNPFVNVSDHLPEIYTYGNRNVQGATLHPQTGIVWTHEHGPQGGDEINVVRAGVNYGWPIITYGEEYGGGEVGKGLTEQEGLAQPLHYWTPSIAPSGMTFVSGDKYPDWQGSLLVGSLKFRLLVRLTVNGEQVTEVERLLKNQLGRIRAVQQAPDGYLYVLTDSNDGALYRLEPR